MTVTTTLEIEIAVVFTFTMSAVAAVAGIWLASLVLALVGCGWLAAEAEVIINNIVVIVIASHDEMRDFLFVNRQ